MLRQVKEIAKQLGFDPKSATLRMDKGGEFSVKEMKKVVPDTYTVATGSSVEARNRMVQQAFFRIIKNRRATTIREALRQSEVIINQSYNRIQKATPNELVAKKQSKKETLAQYNRTRKTHVAGDKRKDFQVGQFVRILIKKPKGDLNYKSYKDLAYTARVFKIEKRTQGKRRGQPIKYRVNKKWYTQDKLIKSAPRDQISERIIEERDDAEDEKDSSAEKKRVAEQKDRDFALALQKEEQIKAGTRRQTRSGAAKNLKEKLRKQKEEGERIDRLLDYSSGEEEINNMRKTHLLDFLRERNITFDKVPKKVELVRRAKAVRKRGGSIKPVRKRLVKRKRTYKRRK